MSTSSRVSFSISHRRPAASRSWLTFFLAAMGMGMSHAAEQEVMKYWWVMPESEPEPAPQVFRVTGEKGENFEPVYNFEELVALQNDPAVVAARAARQEALRQEAMVLVRKLRQEGKSPMVAYEEAWTQVYSSHWLNANGYEGSSRLEELLTRLASEEDDFALTPEEEQIVLEALLEADHRLESSQGRELLRRLAVRLRALGYGKLYSSRTMSDQLMKRFADSMEQGMDSMSAYRDALFKTYRDRIMCFTMRGYMPPAGLRGQPRYYHQAPQKLTTTVATGALPGAPALKEFLATSPAGSDSTGEEEEDEEKKRLEDEQTLATQSSATSSAPAAGGGGGGGAAPSMRGFSMRAAAPETVADQPLPPNAITGGTNTSFHTNTSVSGHNLTYGNSYATSWKSTLSQSVEKSDWLGMTVTATVNFSGWYGDSKIAGTPSSFTLAGGNLYLGSGYTGEIVVDKGYAGSVLHAESLEHASVTQKGGFLNMSSATAHAVYQVAGSGVFNYGTLAGGGELTLSNNAAENNAVIYIFNDADATGWFDGTIKFGASRKGIVELDLGAKSGSSTAWSKTEFNMSGIGTATDGYGIRTSDAPSRTILNIRGNVSIAGLSGGDDTSTVTSESGDFFYDLTLGDEDGEDYVYSGSFNGSYYITATTSNGRETPSALDLIKTGENQQTFTEDIDNDGNRLHSVTVNGGTLRFDGDGEYYDSLYTKSVETRTVTVNGGELLLHNLTVTEQQEGAAELLVTGGKIEANGNIDVAYDMGITGGGSVSTSNLQVGNNLGVSGTGSSLAVTNSLDALAMRVEKGGKLHTHDINVTANLEVGTESHQVAGMIDAQRASLTSTGRLTAGELRLRGDGLLVTGNEGVSVSGGHIHGGAVWELAGSTNTMAGELRLENVGGAGGVVTLRGTGDTPAVLTLPGTISLTDADWNGGANVLFSLDNVNLDFSKGVTLTNTGLLNMTAGQTFLFASVSTKNGGGFTANSSSVLLGGTDALWHGVLGYDNSGKNIIITLKHKEDKPLAIESGKMLYIEMYQDAHYPALPYKVHDTYSNGAWRGTPDENKTLPMFLNVKLSEEADLYLGEDAGDVAFRKDRHFGGGITVSATTTSGDAAQLHGEIDAWGNWLLDGHLGGSGELKLVAHHSNDDGSTPANPATTKPNDNSTLSHKTEKWGNASTFTFTNAATPDKWLNGKVSLANTGGGIVQLNIGNVDIANQGDTRWSAVEIDLTNESLTDKASGASGTANALVLGVMGDATVAGISGSSSSSSVVSDVSSASSAPSPVLILGNSSGRNYTFAGTVGSGRFYTGGQAYSVTSTLTSTVTTNNGSTTTTNTTIAEHNFVTMGEGRLSLTKVGSNKQTFKGNVYLDQVLVKEGELQMIGGETKITSMSVYDGAKVTTGSNVSLGTMSLYGGSTWYTNNRTPNSYSVTLNLVDVYGESGTKTINIGAPNASSWIPAMYVNMAAAGVWQQNASAIFNLQTATTLDLDSLRVYTNLSGISGGEKIALYQLPGSTKYTFKDNVVMVEDKSGHFYDADYVQDGNIIYLQLEKEARHYGIVVNSQPEHKDLVGYIWSGENTGKTTADVHHINLGMGTVWRADGSAENTGWHEQRAVGSSNDDIGKYVDGNTVYFLDTDVHGEDETHRMVHIKGKVAPGQIIIDTDKNAGFLDPSTRDVEYHVEYGYAFVDADGTGSIVDYVDAEGREIPTSMTLKGTGLVVLNLANNFSGGIDVQNGGLYIATVGAAGTGALTFHTDQSWSFDVQGQTPTNTGKVDVVDYTMNRVGSELMICYQHSDEAVSGFRGSTLRNDIILSSTQTNELNDFAGSFKVSFAYAAFNESAGGDKNLSNIPRHWRSLTLSGALTGTGYYTETGGIKTWVNTSANDTLELTGYCSTWVGYRDQSYVTAFTLTEDTAGKDAYIRDTNGNILNRFQGKVVLLNTVNTSPLPSNELSNRIGGTVQVNLKGEKFAEAHLDMTRESVRQPQWDGDGSNPRQTYNNILVINGDTTLKGLSANFRGCGYDFGKDRNRENEVDWGDKHNTTRLFQANLSQDREVWHVRTLTNGLNTLKIGEYGDTSNTATYVYSGAMGFRQAYAGLSEAHVPWGDGFYEHTAEGWYFSQHSMAQETLSVVKSSNSQQYIHTAKLNDVSVYEGLLGFNNLELIGNLNLVGGSRLELGKTGTLVGAETGTTDDDIIWHEIGKDSSSTKMQQDYKKVYTSKDVTVNSGKTLTVFTPYVAGTEPTSAVVVGNVILDSKSALTFLPNGMIPDYSYDTESTPPVNPLLDVYGTLQFKDSSAAGLSVNLTGVNFSQVQIKDREATYFYLAGADNIEVGDNGDSSTFQSRIMSLGYGYFGVLDTLDSSGLANNNVVHKSNDARDYLVIRVYGDPRCTWSGKTEVTREDVTREDETFKQTFKPGNVWTNIPASVPDKYDYRWKENTYFENGMTVLFGNLYEPVEWTPTSELKSTQTPIVKLDKLQPGHPADSVTVDGHTISWSEGKPAAYRYENVVINGRVAPLSVVINSDYYDASGKKYTDSTNYYFTADSDDDGYIADATEDELKLWKEEYGVDDLSWKTNLTKLGTGTTIMTTDNRFTGGTEIIGGRIVMQHVNALGFVYNTHAHATETTDDDKWNLDDIHKDKLLTGLDCTITLMNGGELMGDFSDDDYPGNHQENITTSLGAAMDTTTIRNKVVVNVYADPNNPAYDTIVDGRIFNNTAHKLVLTTLEGETDTVIEFAGVGLTEEQSKAQYDGKDNMFRYGVFKVLDPGGFSGTVVLSGKHWALSNDGKTADLVNGGNVQLNIMSSTKSGSKDWTKATVDLSIKDGTNRTVLGLDATGQVDAVLGYECVYLNSIQGKVATGSSSVLNMSLHNPLTLILTGTRSGEYEGVMGYGDFEVSVDYGGYAGLHGTTQHHYGAVKHGSLNLIKRGEGSIQTARRAWLNSVKVEGGTFQAAEALVAHDITTGGGKRVMVGDVDKATLYALSVGKGGTLAMNTTFNVSGSKTDAWAGVSAGTTVGDSTTPAGWVLLENGATLSAREDWYTRKQVDIETNAAVTINAHNFIIDPYLTTQYEDGVSNEVVDKYAYSHIIQLLGDFKGKNVHLTVNNQLTNPNDGDAYVNLKLDSPYMGYVALNDLNDLTGSSTVNIGSMTVLQIMQAHGGEKSDVDITVEGKNATLQILDKVTSYNDSNSQSTSDSMVQYIDKIVFGANVDTDVTKDPLTRENNGQLLLGGSEKTTLVGPDKERIKTPDLADRQVLISSRHNSTSLKGEITNLNIDLRSNAVKIGGDAAQRSEMSNVHIDMARNDVKHEVYHTNLRNSMIHLMEDCSVSLENAVLLDYNSVVRGVKLNYELPKGETISQVVGGTVDPFKEEPNVAAGYQTENRTTEVRTSVNTTVQLTFADEYEVYSASNGSKILVLQTEQFLGVDVDGTGLTIQLYEDPFALAEQYQAKYVAFMMGGKSGQFFYEEELQNFDALLDSQFVLQNRDGEQMAGYWISSVTVQQETGSAQVSMHMLYFRVPEPATATLSLLALTALCARRRRK